MHKMSPMQDTLTTAEVAQRLFVHRSVVTKMVKAGRLRPTMKLPGDTGAYLFATEDVERLIAERNGGAAA